METEVNEISINGKVYVPKEEVEKEEMNTEDYVIVRTYSAGVFAGNLLEKDLAKQVVVMKNARRLWYWDGAASLSQLAVNGVTKPENCKFPCEVPEITLLQVIEIIPCSKKAIKSIKGVKEWKA